MTSAGGSGAPTDGGRWVDSHCHLQDTYRPGDVDALHVVVEAAEAGVVGLVCVGTDAHTSRQAVAFVDEVRAACRSGLPAVPGDFGAWATVGLHPHDASNGLAEVETVLEDALARNPGVVVGVGECGLDYHYDHSPRSAQREMFAAQVALADRLALTLVVHTRDAWADTLDILRGEQRPDRIVLHCFTGGPEEARRCLDLGAFLSFSGIVTFKSADDVRAAAALCPIDRLLVETDAPFLAPVPHRGESNRPALVPVVGDAVAAVKSMATEDLAASSRAAALRAFAVS
ncbi:MAG TPA: TatD family hydrolase [Acidimicrobiales bacterium]|nr:TatD family hydrolase [Acidimicrobiales bacterium]